MIRLPRRSVTRFFIPLIDVLTLLFCTFLLLPMLQATPGGPAEDPRTALERENQDLKRKVEQLTLEARQKPEDLQKELARLRQEKEQLLKEKALVLQDRLAIRTLEVRAGDGELIYRDALNPQGVPLARDVDVRQLIADDRARAASAGKELYYLVLLPRDPTSVYPRQSQYERFEGWFQDVAHGYDRPGGGLAGKGGAP